MATKNQHYVPRVYIKSWETQVESRREPQKTFMGVYQFTDSEEEGDGITGEAILWKPHLYTIGFHQMNLVSECPEVYNYFVRKVYEAMISDRPKPVYGKLGYSNIKTKKSVHKHLQKIDAWDFYYEDGSTASKNKILRQIYDMRCYLIEEAFSSTFESKWQSIKNTFVNEVKAASPSQAQYGEKVISQKTAEDMMEFFFMMYCRSPQFDPFGVYSWIMNLLNDAFSDSQLEVKEMMKEFWFTELYRMLFKKGGGFYHTALARTIENCQMVLFEANSVEVTFITSDNPAFNHISVVETENNSGFYFPLDPQHLLFIAKGSGDINKVAYTLVNGEQVRKINRIIGSHRTKTIVANAKNRQSFM